MPRRLRSPGLLAALCVLGCQAHEEPPWDLPEPTAASKYVEFGAWADVSVTCMDDQLLAWDRYIEEIAAFMRITPRRGGIRYTWAPNEDSADRFPCGRHAGCAYALGREHPSYVFARDLEMLHELVHAVELPARGGAHPVLNEGMAEYLSVEYSTDHLLAGYAEAFEELLDDSLAELSYPRAMHFVGSLVERHGVEKYYAYRAMLGEHATWADFADAHQKVYGEALPEALKAMEQTAVRGRLQPWGCERSRPALPWTTERLLEATLSGQCGDGGFYGGGFVANAPGFSKSFTVDVAISGVYEMTVEGIGDHHVEIASCPGVEYSILLGPDPMLTMGILWAGRHHVRVDFPQSPSARGEVTLKLEFLAPAGL